MKTEMGNCISSELGQPFPFVSFNMAFRTFLFRFLRSRLFEHELALLIQHAPFAIDKADTVPVVFVHVVEAVRVPSPIKSRPGKGCEARGQSKIKYICNVT